MQPEVCPRSLIADHSEIAMSLSLLAMTSGILPQADGAPGHETIFSQQSCEAPITIREEKIKKQLTWTKRSLNLCNLFDEESVYDYNGERLTNNR
jgi:hypothetical protein